MIWKKIRRTIFDYCFLLKIETVKGRMYELIIRSTKEPDFALLYEQ